MKRTNNAVWLDKYNRWQIKVQKDGIRRTFTCSTPGRNGKRQCNEKADAWLDDNVSDTKLKISLLTDKYMEQLRLTTSQSHWKQYEGYCNNWINPTIGNVRIENLTEQHFQSVINKGYSKDLNLKTLKNIRACMQNFLKYCRSCRYTTLFFENLKIPKGAKTKVKTILQPNEINILFNIDTTFMHRKLVKELYINYFRLAVITGLRPGELVGLKWSDIKDNTIYLQRSINIFGEITDGKNENAHRALYVMDLAAAVLTSQKQLLKELKLKSEYIFVDEFGEHVKQKNTYNHWNKYCIYNCIHKTTPYELRHTFVSAVKSLPEGYLKDVVGHSKNMDTFGTYSHALRDEKKSVAYLIQDIFVDMFKHENNK